MNILIMTPGAVGFKSPTVYVAEELQRRGHRVGLVVDPDGHKIVYEGDWDVVFGDMERSCVPAFLTASTLGVKCYLHGEWIPKFRVERTNEWGPGCISSDEEIAYWKAFYRPIAGILHKADVSSWASPIFRKYAEQFSGREYGDFCFDRFTRLPSNVPSEPVPMEQAEYAVAICSRLAPIKRVPALVEAVGRMKTHKPRVYVVGDGPDRLEAIQKAREYGLDIEFCGATGEEDKWGFLAKSRVMLSAWTGIPPGEALMLGRPTIAYDHPHIRELYGDTLLYVKNNSIDAMAQRLDEVLEFSGYLNDFAQSGRKKLLDGETGLKTFDRGVDEIENVLLSLA